MTRNLPALILVLAASLSLLSGCATVLSKNGVKDKEADFGHVYSGTTTNFSMWSCYGAMVSKEPLNLLWSPIVVPLLLLDLPLSLIADTIVLPVDVVTEPKRERFKFETERCKNAKVHI